MSKVDWNWVEVLSSWFEKNQRTLPWRKTKDPYAIWVSEVMLQQTQVATVIAYYEKFLKRFPTLSALALAKEEEVLVYWSGLGYYRRAKLLHQGAKWVFKNGFPKTKEELLKVPGVGSYTAGAILSIAFNQKEALVDGNVKRVFARFLGEKRFIQKKEVEARFWNFAREAVSYAKNPSVFNQALMELGALICVKHDPLCTQCPIQNKCVAYKDDLQKKLPKVLKRQKKVKLYWFGFYISDEEKVFLSKHTGKWWKDMWGIPYLEFSKPMDILKVTKAFNLREFKLLSKQLHHVTHHDIYLQPILTTADKLKKIPWKGKWISKQKAHTLPMSSLTKKVLNSV